MIFDKDLIVHVPGLKSDAKATLQPLSSNLLPLAYLFLFKKNVVPCNIVATVFDYDKALNPLSSITIRWSADKAPTSFASSEAPKHLNSSA